MSALDRLAPAVRSRWHLLAAGALIAALMAPMALTGSTFGQDWPTHLWLIQMQARNISALGHPSLFFQSAIGAFEPWYAFYGATLYSLAAAGAVLSGGHTLSVYILSYAMAMAMALGAFAWLARQAGLRGWIGLIPGAVFLTSAYYVTDVYARGAWAEAVATSAIPLVVAGAISLVRAERWRPGPVLAFVLGVVVFTGSHNITLLYGTLFLAWLAVTVAVAVGRQSLPSSRRVLAVLGLGLLAGAVNLWFVLPDIVYGGRTTIGHSFTQPPKITGEIPLGTLLDPTRRTSMSNSPTFDLQLPTLALLWSLAVLACCWRDLARSWRRAAVAALVAGLPFVAPLLVPHLWLDVPHALWSIQFPYRLLSYVDYSVVGLVLVALVALAGRSRTPLTLALILVGVLFAAFEVRQAMVQEWNTSSSLASRSEVFPGGGKVPSLWIKFVTTHQDQDVSLPVVGASIIAIPGVTVNNSENENLLYVPAGGRVKSSYTITFTPPESGTINTNVITGPYLVGVKGARIVGRSPGQNMVIQVKRDGTRPISVTFGTAGTWPIVVGRWATFASILALAALLVALALRRGDPATR